MDQTADEIRQRIEARRGRLVQDINELEYRMRETVDLRQQFRQHTAAILGAAFAGGLLFGLMTGPAPVPHRNSYRT